jgi:hypothetical protein
VYTIRFWFIKDLSPFVGNDDPATLDDELILLHAVANAKAHYRQPDAQVYQGQLNSLLGHIRGLSFGSSGTYRRTKPGEADRKPLVIGRDVP